MCKSRGKKRERTSIYPADEKAVYNDRNQRSEDDRDLASLVRNKNNKAVSAIQQPFWVKVLQYKRGNCVMDKDLRRDLVCIGVAEVVDKPYPT